MISGIMMISYMMVRCLYPPPKTRCIECCQSSALQVQVQDVQNSWLWSSALLDEARLVLGVRRIQTGDVRRSVSQSFVRWRPAPHQAAPVLIVRHSWRLAWCCTQCCPYRSGTCRLQDSRISWAFRFSQTWEHNSSVTATALSPVPLASKLQWSAICPIFFVNSFNCQRPARPKAELHLILNWIN